MTAELGPIDDSFQPAAVAHLFKTERTPMMACCPHDSEPLVATFERDGAEFTCVVCNRWFGFMSPKPMPPTRELEARATAHRELYLQQRARRAGGE